MFHTIDKETLSLLSIVRHEGRSRTPTHTQKIYSVHMVVLRQVFHELHEHEACPSVAVDEDNYRRLFIVIHNRCDFIGPDIWGLVGAKIVV